jgi:replicative DNA helicase
MPKESPENLNKQIQKRLVASLLYDGTEANRVLEIVSTEDIQEPAFQLIYNAMGIIARQDQLVSSISVAEQLENEGNLKKVGGSVRLYALRDQGSQYILEAPVELYAKICKDASVKDKMFNLLEESKGNFSLDSGFSVIDALSELQSSLNQELYRISDDATSSLLSDDFDEYIKLIHTRQEIASKNTDKSGLQGIPSLLPTINHYTSGWLPGQLITIGARTGVGKALALDTPIRTSLGLKTMGDIKVGWKVFGRDGKLTRVTNVTQEMSNRKCYSLTTHNGEQIIADADHLWLTETVSSRKAKSKAFSAERVRTTQEIVSTLRVGRSQRTNHSIRVGSPIEGTSNSRLPIDPYLLGYWLGDGHSWSASLAVHNKDYPSLRRQIKKAGYYFTVNKNDDTYAVGFSAHPISRGGNIKRHSTKQDLRALDLLQNKHIPECYFVSSIENRRDLLAGLLDSDGSVNKKKGRIEFGVTNERLANDFYRLVSSLGLVAFRTDKKVKGKTIKSSTAYTITFKANFNPFKLERKAAYYVPRKVRHERFYIVDACEVPSTPVKCIEVDNEDHTYLAGIGMIPTHNSVLAVNNAVAAAQAGSSVQFFSLEMTDPEIKDRIVSSVSGVPMNKLRSGEELSELEKNTLKQVEPELRRMKIRIETDAKVTIDSIRAKALNQAQSPEGLDLIIIDYLQLITPIGKYNSRQEAVADISRSAKLLAKQLEVPVMVLVQVNRENKDDESSIPRLNQIRESGAIAQDSDIVLLLHRDEPMDDSIPHTLVILEKNRNGEANKTVRCHSNLECSLFREVVRAKDIEPVERLTEDEQDDLVSDFDDDFLYNEDDDEADF